MRIKSVKNKIRRLCGVTVAAAVTALAVFGCVGSTGLEAGNDSKLILPKGEAWVHTFDPPSNLPQPNSSRNALSRSPNVALIFKADGKVERLGISSDKWYVEYQQSWSTLGSEMTLSGKGADTTFTFSLTGEGSEQILTLERSDRYYLYSLRGFERRAIEISDGKNQN
jgi:hypothetical protein